MRDSTKLKKLNSLKQYRENGIISADEYEERKSRLLNRRRFWNRAKILPIVGILAIFSAIGSYTFYRYSAYEQGVQRNRQDRLLTSKVASQAKLDASSRVKAANTLYSDWQNADQQVETDLVNFDDSAFGEMKYINMPGYYTKWIKQLDTLKADIEKENQYTKNIKSAPDALSAYFSQNPKSCLQNMEVHYNTFVETIGKFNQTINDYNNWAANYIKLGGKADYLDKYTAAEFSNKIDLDGDGKIETGLVDYLSTSSSKK